MLSPSRYFGRIRTFFGKSLIRAWRLTSAHDATWDNGYTYGDAGLRELTVQSEVVAEGSIERLLEGKNHNLAVRLHKVVYKALFRMLLNNFETSLPAHAMDIFQQKEILVKH